MERLWRPPSNGRSTIQVIERGDPADDRTGLPFGFSRALVEHDPQPSAEDGWEEHAEIVAGEP